MAHISGGNRFGSIRFGSGLFEKSSVRLGSVRKVEFPSSTQFSLCFLNASWLGPVRFGSFPRPVPAGSEIKRFGSVRLRPVQFGFLLLPVIGRTLPRAAGKSRQPPSLRHGLGLRHQLSSGKSSESHDR